MSESVSLPALGESVTEGTVTRWLKNVGDRVEVDEPLVEVSTDKVDTEIPSPVAGVIEAILVQEDETVEVGTALVTIGDGSGAAAPAEAAAPAATAEAPADSGPSYASPAPEAEAAPAAPAPSQEAQPAVAEVPSVDSPAPADQSAPPVAPPTPTPVEPAPAAPAPAPAAPAPAAPAARGSHAGSGYVTPIVRKLANEAGVDLSTLTGTGVGGRIRKQDIADAKSKAGISAPAAPVVEVSPLRGTTQPMSRLRKVVAERAVASMQTSAQLTTVVEVDVTRIAILRDKVKADFLAKTGNKLSFLPFFALAATEALQAYPIVNATIDGDSIVYPAQENISIAVDTERGLLTPVVRNAAALDIAGFAAQIADLAERTRQNKLKPDELAGGTFTLTNTGSRGALFDTPVVFLPQSAILGTGIVYKKPVVVTNDGLDSIAIRSSLYLALSYDHRIIDGADAARFLTMMKQRLESGAFEGNLGL
ncbi:MAG: dihydrolipoamide succinyltransferase [Cryobacterium sp.]|nr:dihydrolipoamide succinyltransferase [Cryobacterium sp.]